MALSQKAEVWFSKQEKNDLDLTELWFKNEWIYMKQWRGYTTLVASDKYPDMNKITELIAHYKATQKP